MASLMRLHWRLLHAVRLCHSLMISFYTIASDSKQVVNDIIKGNQGRYGSVINEIKMRAMVFNCKFSFEGRAVNVKAHSLAKFSHSLDQGRHIWLAQPMIPLVSHLLWVFYQ